MSIIITLCLLSACSRERVYRIGVSQCSQDIWRDKLNEELRMTTYFYDKAVIDFASADDDDDRQMEQVDGFVSQKVDLLIVAPNQSAVAPAIDRAYDAGIPVIVFDRKTTSDKFTAYIGADNYGMGLQMGLYIAKQMHGRGRVLEVMGLQGSSPAIDRHRGFTDAMKQYPDIEVVASLQGDWTEESAVSAVRGYRGDLSALDYVFAQNDRMAVGARKALAQRRELNGTMNTRFCGIDALPVAGGGIELVREGVLDASYIYPTRGDLVLQLAMDILEGRPYQRENPMKAAIVTRDNAETMLMQAEEMANQHRQLDGLHSRVVQYLMQYRHQQVYTLLMVLILVLVVGGAWFALQAMQRRHQIEREAFALVVNNGAEAVPVEALPQAAANPAVDVEAASAPDTDNGEAVAATDGGTVPTADGKQAGRAEALVLSNTVSSADTAGTTFLERLRTLVQEKMCDSNFSVETLAQDMGMSRVQLYRKVKQLTGRTPVDIIRMSRLNRARNMLAGGEHNVSEVAYAVGFSAPSYFAKCFRDEFGYSPTEMKVES